MKTSQLAAILVCVVLAANAFAQNNPPPQGSGPSKGAVKAAKPNVAAKTGSNATPGAI